jgi:3-hydroxyacyl-CoA dehydrogenase
MAEIAKVAVIGAGVMGASIAAHVANSGTPVLLLDIVPKDNPNRNAIAEGAVAKLLKADPAPLMTPRAARLIETGNVEDHLEKLADCDWIIEAVIERLDIKHDLYARIDKYRKAGAAISSNTSTIPLHELTGGLPDHFTRDFLITHFFNPPRYMRLLELVIGPKTDPELAARVARFCDFKLGKTVVGCKDTPGFIANRIGTFWMQRAISEAMDSGVGVEDADAALGKPLGIPKTGVFGLIDLVGLDLMPHVLGSLDKALPAADALHKDKRDVPLFEKMIADGYTGRKGKGGFYRLNLEHGRVKEAIDLKTGDYHTAAKAELPGALSRDAKALLSSDDRLGRFAWKVMGPTLAYASGLVPEIADDIVAVDEAMRLGFGWKWGPFELIDVLGAGWLAERIEAEGLTPSPLLKDAAAKGGFYRLEGGKRQFLGVDGAYHDRVRPEGVLLLEDIKLAGKPLLKNGGAALWDIGDGVACLEFTSKMNALDDQMLSLLRKSIDLVKAQFKALVIYNEGSNFSAGANLGLALFAANIAAWSEIDKLIASGQQAYKAMKYAPFPTVAAPAGLALGGGCEICLHAAAIQAHAETYIGLVECGVGLVPGWGGNGEMLDRWTKSGLLPHGPMPAVAKVFEILSTATVSKSAAQAQELMFLRPSDRITMNRDRLLADAKARALALVDGYVPPAPPEFRLPGPSGRTAMDMAAEAFRKQGIATPHDIVVADTLAEVLSGGDTDMLDILPESRLLELERAAFMKLAHTAPTLARIESVLETGKPLRN